MYISEVSKTLNLSKKAIELYEHKNLITPQKDESGYRIYGKDELKRLKQIQVLRNMDFSIVDIQDILLNHKYERFNEKMEALQKEEMRIKTIIQYFDYVKVSLDEDKELEEVSEDLLTTFDIIDDDLIEEKVNKLARFNFYGFSFSFLGVLLLIIVLHKFDIVNQSFLDSSLIVCISLFVLFNITYFQLAVIDFFDKHRKEKR